MLSAFQVSSIRHVSHDKESYVAWQSRGHCLLNAPTDGDSSVITVTRYVTHQRHHATSEAQQRVASHDHQFTTFKFHEIIAMDMEEEEKVLVTLGRKAFNVSRMVSSDYLINDHLCATLISFFCFSNILQYTHGYTFNDSNGYTFDDSDFNQQRLPGVEGPPEGTTNDAPTFYRTCASVVAIGSMG